MAYHVPKEETLEPPALAALQRTKLSALLGTARRRNRFYGGKLADLAFDPDRDELSDLPFTTRDEIQQDQAAHPPYGTNLTYPLEDYIRLHQTSGSMGVPLRILDRRDDWRCWIRCWGIIYRAAGVTPRDRFLFPFSFGPFLGFWAAFDGALELGNLCLPGGGMTTAARLRFMIDNSVTVIACTPTYALRMAEVAAEEGIDLAGAPVRALFVAGEPGGSIPSTRAKIESAWGARVFDHAGMTEVGPYAFECLEAPGGMHVIESEFIPEVVDPTSGHAVPAGTTGELVLTNLGRWGAPLIRYRTGDSVRMTRGRCACGRSFARLEGGILGRRDDMLFIRGNNVFPAAIEAILREFSGVAEFRLEVDARGAMADLRIDIEPTPDADRATLAAEIVRAVRDRLGFTPQVCLVEAGALPRFELKARRVVRRGSKSGD